MGKRSFPLSVKEYSTWGGISSNWVLFMSPSSSSSRRALERTVLVIPGRSSLMVPKRALSWMHIS